jgi:hypothetical protein
MKLGKILMNAMILMNQMILAWIAQERRGLAKECLGLDEWVRLHWSFVWVVSG